MRYKKWFGRDVGKKGEKLEEREKRNGGDRLLRREKLRGDVISMDVVRFKGMVVEYMGFKVMFD